MVLLILDNNYHIKLYMSFGLNSTMNK